MMYVLNDTQVFVPIVALLICFGIFILGARRGITMKREEADTFSRLALDDSKAVFSHEGVNHGQEN